jgi:hypothetical protein
MPLNEYNANRLYRNLPATSLILHLLIQCFSVTIPPCQGQCPLNLQAFNIICRFSFFRSRETCAKLRNIRNLVAACRYQSVAMYTIIIEGARGASGVLGWCVNGRKHRRCQGHFQCRDIWILLQILYPCNDSISAIVAALANATTVTGLNGSQYAP